MGEIKLDCPVCGAKISANSKKAGTAANCPRCGELLRIPDLPASDLPPEQPPTEPQPIVLQELPEPKPASTAAETAVTLMLVGTTIQMAGCAFFIVAMVLVFLMCLLVAIF